MVEDESSRFAEFIEVLEGATKEEIATWEAALEGMEHHQKTIIFNPVDVLYELVGTVRPIFGITHSFFTSFIIT